MIKRKLKNFLRLFNYHPKDMPNWKKILKKKNKYNFENQYKNKKILIATSSGGHKLATSLESLIGVSLSLKGADVDFLLCDKVLKGCIMTTTENTNEKDILKNKNLEMCDSCYYIGNQTFKKTGLNVLKFSDFIEKSKANEIKNLSENLSKDEMLNYHLNEVNIGEQTKAGVLRYYAVGDIELEKNGIKILRKYFESALNTFYATENLLKKKNYDTIVINHGIYVPQGIIFEIAKKKNINVVTWLGGARNNTFIFSHDKTYNKDITEEDVADWKNINLQNVEKTIDDYLDSKIFGSQDWKYHDNKVDLDVDKYFENKKIDKSLPCIGLTTNVIWDAQFHYDNIIFDNMVDWLFKTIKFFINRPDMNLLIRVHPTEVKSDRPARQKVKDEILKNFKFLPKNIIIIDSNEDISTYKILNNCNCILVYGTKLGAELCAKGYPIIVAGEAIIRNKGFALEPSSEEEYLEMLNSLPIKEKVNKQKIEEAKKFAFYYYFQRQLQIDSLESIPLNFPPFKVKDNFLSNFHKKKDYILDLICDSIISKKKFKDSNDKKNN